jgi:hypothetical protein
MALATPASALMREVPLHDLVGGSAAIVRAEVTGVESHWTADHTTIVSDVTLRVAESWAGGLAPGSRLALEVEGGEVGDIGIFVEHQPRFHAGERVVLFLRSDPSARLRVNALEQGKFSVVDDQVISFRQQVMPLRSLQAMVNSLWLQRGGR